MDSDYIIYLFLTLGGAAIAVFTVASYRIYDSEGFWASRLAWGGSLLSLVAWILFFAYTYDESSSSSSSLSSSGSFLIITGVFALLGIIPSLLGLIGICARFRSASRRLAELEELSAHLRKER